MALGGRDYLTARGQVAALQRQARALDTLEMARYYGALVDLASHPAFQTILDHWMAAVLLAPVKTSDDMGKQHFVLQVFHDLRDAAHGRTLAHQEAFHYEHALGGTHTGSSAEQSDEARDY